MKQSILPNFIFSLVLGFLGILFFIPSERETAPILSLLTEETQKEIAVTAKTITTTSQELTKKLNHSPKIAPAPSQKKLPAAGVHRSDTSFILVNEAAILKNAPYLDPPALHTALHGYEWALKRGHVKNPNLLTLIDFNRPSSSKRLWVIDMRSHTVLMNLYTTHGKNSGLDYAKQFSARVGSDMTSLGVYETLNPYQGGHGLSLKLQGLEPGVNDTALRRAVVVHPAWYATPAYIEKNHRAGRSWGCFAIDPAIASKLVHLIGNGSVLFAYANQEKSDGLLV